MQRAKRKRADDYSENPIDSKRRKVLTNHREPTTDQEEDTDNVSSQSDDDNETAPLEIKRSRSRSLDMLLSVIDDKFQELENNEQPYRVLQNDVSDMDLSDSETESKKNMNTIITRSKSRQQQRLIKLEPKRKEPTKNAPIVIEDSEDENEQSHKSGSITIKQEKPSTKNKSINISEQWPPSESPTEISWNLNNTKTRQNIGEECSNLVIELFKQNLTEISQRPINYIKTIALKARELEAKDLDEKDEKRHLYYDPKKMVDQIETFFVTSIKHTASVIGSDFDFSKILDSKLPKFDLSLIDCPDIFGKIIMLSITKPLSKFKFMKNITKQTVINYKFDPNRHTYFQDFYSEASFDLKTTNDLECSENLRENSKVFSYLALREFIGEIGILRQINKSFALKIDNLSPSPAFAVAAYLKIFDCQSNWWENYITCTSKNLKSTRKASEQNKVQFVWKNPNTKPPNMSNIINHTENWKFLNEMGFFIKHGKLVDFINFVFEDFNRKSQYIFNKPVEKSSDRNNNKDDSDSNGNVRIDRRIQSSKQPRLDNVPENMRIEYISENRNGKETKFLAFIKFKKCTFSDNIVDNTQCVEPILLPDANDISDFLHNQIDGASDFIYFNSRTILSALFYRWIMNVGLRYVIS